MRIRYTSVRIDSTLARLDPLEASTLNQRSTERAKEILDKSSVTRFTRSIRNDDQVAAI